MQRSKNYRRPTPEIWLKVVPIMADPKKTINREGKYTKKKMNGSNKRIRGIIF